MFMLDLVAWWYGAGWSGVLKATGRRIRGLGEMFSTGTLMKTLFAPWKRITTSPGAGLDAKMRAMGDNLVSRCVGFVVRLFVLLAAAVSFVFLLLAGLAELVVWPLVPVAGIVCIVWGFL